MPRKPRPKILAMIMAGGKGKRLAPLTNLRTKPAVPFAGKYRIVDFVLSNFVNSNIMAIYVLVQYRSQSLIEHLRKAWRIGGRIKQNFITVVPPQMKTGETWYEGTADAVYQNLNLIQDFGPDLVCVFGADHIYRMDVDQMVEFHLSQRAEITVAALPVPLESATGFGVLETDATHRIVGFEEKPSNPKSIPTDPDRAYSSMGNYVFETDVLAHILQQDAARPGSHDFGKDILPKLATSHRMVAYNFLENEIPDLQPYEERGYWRDVGTLETYWQAHMDLLGEKPLFDLRNNSWPIMSDSSDGPAASIVRSQVDTAMIGQGSHIIDANISRSVIGRNVRIERGSHIEGCIILDGAIVGAHSTLRRVIADRFQVISPGTSIGDHGSDGAPMSSLVVLPRGRSVGERALGGPGHTPPVRIDEPAGQFQP